MASPTQAPKRPAMPSEAVPLHKRPKVTSAVTDALSSGVVKKPELPASSDRDASTRAVMKKVIPWVVDKLPAEILKIPSLPWIGGSGGSIVYQPPLRIPTAGHSTVSSYKEPWEPSHCLMSCQESGCYEAGGNLC